MDPERLQSLRTAGALLAIAALLAAILMHYHPHGGDEGGLIRGVHGGLILLFVVPVAVMGLVAGALGWRLLTALAFAFFALGSTGGMLAGSINGFVTPALAEYPAGEIGPGVGALAWEANQALATLGAIGVGAGIALYALALWQAGWRCIGGAGLLAGTVPAALLAGGITDMHFHGAMLTYFAQLAWLLLLGAGLFRAAGRVSLPSTP